MAENTTMEMVKAAVRAAAGRRARDPLVLDVRQLDSFTDFFAICSGTSDIQIESISEAVLEALKSNWNVRPWHREGERRSDWILLDYVDFVVHIFLDEKRKYYNLERLWTEAPMIEVPGLEVEEGAKSDAYNEELSVS